MGLSGLTSNDVVDPRTGLDLHARYLRHNETHLGSRIPANKDSGSNVISIEEA